jgi:chromate transport protein ChrA
VTTIYRSRQVPVQLAAMAALLLAALVAALALTQAHDPATAGQMAGLAYGAAVATAAVRWRVAPLLTVMASVQIAAVLVAAVPRKIRRRRK